MRTIKLGMFQHLGLLHWRKDRYCACPHSFTYHVENLRCSCVTVVLTLWNHLLFGKVNISEYLKMQRVPTVAYLGTMLMPQKTLKCRYFARMYEHLEWSDISMRLGLRHCVFCVHVLAVWLLAWVPRLFARGQWTGVVVTLACTVLSLKIGKPLKLAHGLQVCACCAVQCLLMKKAIEVERYLCLHRLYW